LLVVVFLQLGLKKVDQLVRVDLGADAHLVAAAVEFVVVKFRYDIIYS
jgi:hypothetical protein